MADLAATRASSAPASGNINVSALRTQAEQDDYNRAYPQASLSADAYAQRDQFEASGFIPSNELPQMSVPGAPLGAFMNDGGSSNGLNYDPSKPYVIVYGQKLSKDQWAAIDRYEAGQTAAEFGAGIWDGIKSLPGGVWNGIKTVGDGYRGLGYLLSGNIDSFQPRSNVTLDSIGRGIYHSSPLGIVGSLMEGRYRQAGSDTFGTAVGFATTKFVPELKNAPGLNYDVAPLAAKGVRALGESAGQYLENWLVDRGLILQAAPSGPRILPQEGPVTFRAPSGATAEEIAQIKAYVDGSNAALEAGYLSPTGRVSTKGTLRTDASLDAALERARAVQDGTPYVGHAGHVPDTTWTGKPSPYSWLDLSPRVNSSLGGQARGYPIGYKPTGFVFEE